jgi:DNA-binding ferritin-like protein
MIKNMNLFKKIVISSLILSLISFTAFSQGKDYQLPQTLRLLQLLDESVQLVHWNAEGTGAYNLHELSDEFHASLDGLKDQTAERLRVLRMYPEISHQKLIGNNNIRFPNGKIKVKDALQLLVGNYEVVILSLNEKIDNSTDDLVTQDLYIGLKGTLQLQQWKLKMQQDIN